MTDQHESERMRLARRLVRAIAEQRLVIEMSHEDRECADYEYAYDACIHTARAALTVLEGEGS